MGKGLISDKLAEAMHTAKTKRGKRILEKRAGQVHENAKNLLIMKGTRTTNDIQSLLGDIADLRKPLVQSLGRRQRELHPFEDASSIEYLCKKNDSSLFLYGSASKKRPFRLVLGRTYDATLLDMAEFRVKSYRSAKSFGGSSSRALGSKPLVVFQGSAFQADEELKQAKSLLLDLFRGPKAEKVSLMKTDHAVVISAEEGKRELQVKHYRIDFKKSGTKLPHCATTEVGPRFTLEVDRRKHADAELWKQAMKVPKELKPKKRKNVTTNALGETKGRIHLGHQDLDKLHQIHFHKPPTKKRKQAEEAEEAEEDE